MRENHNIATNPSHATSRNTGLAAHTEEQAVSFEETAANMTQLTETERQNVNNTRLANALATRATGIAESGNEAAIGMVWTIEEIGVSSREISEITGVIKGISLQSMTIEAARAGERGRDFAVVANEAHNLAQRSVTAANKIEKLISASAAKIQGGLKQAAGVSSTMRHVKRAIKKMSDIVGEIAAALEKQTCGIEHVSQVVVQIDEATHKNVALVEKPAGALQSLDEQAIRQKKAVSAFRLTTSERSAKRAAPRQGRSGFHLSNRVTHHICLQS